MGHLGLGLAAILLMLFSVTLGLMAFISPAWINNMDVDAEWTGRVKSVDASIGIWAMCTKVDFDNTANLIPNSETVDKFSMDDCYAFFSPMSKQIVRVETVIKKDDYSSSVCDHFDTDEDRAAKALAIMTGIKTTAMSDFLTASCSSKGKAVVGLLASANGLNFVAFVLLVLGVFCCRESYGLIQVARYMVNVGLLLTCIMSFLVFNVLRKAKISSLDVSFGPSVYMEFVSFFITCFAGCAIERYEVKVKKDKNSHDTDKRLEAKIKGQQLISRRNKADIV
ncbi:hypothetical protein AC1031_008646 [Aphanomyces cochlioides]|nr:hypothetical protein AC1031_008646 [Aphanomyces cochlioides]